MYDNAIRFHRNESLSEHINRVSELWSRFNDVGQANPNAWVQHDMSAEEIRTPSSSNRPISFSLHKIHERKHVGEHGSRPHHGIGQKGIRIGNTPRKMGLSLGGASKDTITFLHQYAMSSIPRRESERLVKSCLE